jgi:predicted glutamine amidotransferase
MCLIIHRPTNGKRGTGSNVPGDVLDYNSRLNPDGFGIAWRDPKRGLLHEKFAPGKDEYRRFFDLLKSIDRQATVEYVAHYRKATHGAPCKELSHPFVYEDPSAGPVLVFHNGIIPIKTSKGESDTSEFVKRVLANIEPRWWEKPAYKYLIEESIGYSRLLIMTNEGTYRFNQSQWESQQGIWYSTTPRSYSYSSGKGKAWSDYPSSTKPYASKLTTSAFLDERYGDDDDDDYEEDEFLDGLGFTSVSSKPSASGWYQLGHHVTPVSQVDDPEADRTGDRYGVAVCDTCKTSGEFYVIDGKVYLDVPHVDGTATRTPPLLTAGGLVPVNP